MMPPMPELLTDNGLLSLFLLSSMFKTPPLHFTLLVTTGKGLRYATVALLTLEGTKTLDRQ